VFVGPQINVGTLLSGQRVVTSFVAGLGVFAGGATANADFDICHQTSGGAVIPGTSIYGVNSQVSIRSLYTMTRAFTPPSGVPLNIGMCTRVHSGNLNNNEFVQGHVMVLGTGVAS
jgi:hypothetical protein